ncbi:MAG: hypothetical protein OEO21_00055 [Candidatus Krumholzibacteria bacterium]|nr:hypothetical protein [Candidatus Krumholzibacteria bacterium]
MKRKDFVVLVAAATMMSCGQGDLTLDQADPQAVPASPSYDQVFTIVQRQCATCHQGGDAAAGQASRLVAEDGFDADLRTCRGIVDSRFDILSSVERNTMPPGAWPRLTSEERLVLQRWLQNGAEAPCNPAP